MTFWPNRWRGTVPVAEPLSPGRYVTFPGDYGTPTTRNVWRTPSGTPSTARNAAPLNQIPPAGSMERYNKWMRDTKWMNRFLAPLAAFEAGRQIGAALEDGPLSAGDMLPGYSNGWQTTCNLQTGMPLYGPYAGGGSCGFGYLDPGNKWYERFVPDPAYGLVPGPLWYPFASPVPAWLEFRVGQQQPDNAASPEIYTVRLAGAYPDPIGTTRPAPFVQTVPDPAWQSETGEKTWSVPGASARAIPFGIALAAGMFAPKTGMSPAPVPGTDAPPAPVPPRKPVKLRSGKPPLRTRERKWRARGAVAAALWGVGAATEAADFMEAAWWSLSKAARKRAWEENGRKPLTPAERWWYAATHPGDINPADLLQNLAGNAAGDAAGGRGGRHTKEWHQANWRQGWDSRGRGPFETFKRLRDSVDGEGFGGGF